jgi:aminoglycoside phosphotransferase (APT) family kinase protein
MPAPIERDLDATREALTAWFGTVIPDGQDFELRGMGGPQGTGFSSDTLLFDLVYRQSAEPHGIASEEPLVVRIEPTGAFPVFPSYDVSLQYNAMRAVAKHGVPVPNMRWLEEDTSVLGSRFYVMDKMSGVVPTDNPPYHVGGWVFELAPEQRTQLWWSGLEAMSRVHRIDVDCGDFGFLPRPPAGTSGIAHRVNQYERFLDWGCDRSRLPLLVDTLAWLRTNMPQDEPVGIVWGDSRISNQIFRDLECVAVIDWEMVHVGNPVADLAWWVTIDRCLSEGAGMPRAEGLPGPAETAARWEELVGRKAEHFGYYQVFAAFRFAVIMARIAGQMKHYELMPTDHDMDQNNLASLTLARLLEEVGAR